jgi:hypothetical protein
MVNVDLPDGDQDPGPEVPGFMLPGLGGAFLALATIKASKPGWRGLDRCSLREYTEMWRSAGARVGRRMGDQIHWEDGTVEQIPPVDNYSIRALCDERI